MFQPLCKPALLKQHMTYAPTQTFSQAGLNKLPQLTEMRRKTGREVALYNLATRFHLLDQEETYQSISVPSLIEKGEVQT